jgi:hypothetical protein
MRTGFGLKHLTLKDAMTGALVILLLAILFSFAWRDPDQGGVESTPTRRTHQTDERRPADAIRD